MREWSRKCLLPPSLEVAQLHYVGPELHYIFWPSNGMTFRVPPCMFHISAHSASRQAPWIFSILDRCHSISGLCQIASSLKANVNTLNVSAPIFPIWNNNLMHMHCSLKSVIFWSNKTALDTTHSHPAHQCMPQLWNQRQTTTQVLLHHHLDDEFCTNCGSCGAQDVAGGSLTL